MGSWFEVDRSGLSQILGRQSKARAIFELISNAWDEKGVTQVSVFFWALDKSPQVKIVVTDDAPDGFRDLAESYTLFAASRKKTDAELRGRFNVGEKLFLARCLEAEISSTTGTVEFRRDGTRLRSGAKRDAGTCLTAILPMTRKELDEVEADLRELLPPRGISTSVDIFRSSGGTHFYLEDLHGAPDLVFRATLPTELADEYGQLRVVERETIVEVWRHGSGSKLYELGVPVVELGPPFGINVLQKVPLTLDRENVRPAFLKALRVATLDAAHALLKAEDARAEWVTEALGKASAPAVETVLRERFGEKRVSYDPSDLEANKRAASEGYTVIPGGALPGQAWARVRETGATKPAGQLFSTKSPLFSPDGEDVTLPYSAWTVDMKSTVKHIQKVGEALLAQRTGLTIRLVKRLHPANIAACYAPGGFLVLNLQRLGHEWFKRGADGLAVEHVDLLLHELGHEWCGDHLAFEYHQALTRLGARLALLLVQDSNLRRALRRESAIVPIPSTESDQ